MNAQLIESLGTMIPDGNRLSLPESVLSNYADVKKCLLKAGGKYQRGGFFSFSEPAEEILSRLLGGEAIDDAKKYQYYPTPDALADDMIRCACIKPGHVCLEPSAGQGALLTRMSAIVGPQNVYGCELMPQNRRVLNRLGFSVGHDFLDETPRSMGLDVGQGFDRIVANPPFTNGQDVDHIRHMYYMLAAGGRLVTLSSPSWQFRSQKKYVEFRSWLASIGGRTKDVPAGTFKTSGTNIPTVMILITR